MDGVIPSGDYTFSTSEDKSPFPFDSAVFLGANGSDNYGTQTDQIVSGSIKVNQIGNQYVFAFQVELASGMTFSESYNGSMEYADSK